MYKTVWFGFCAIMQALFFLKSLQVSLEPDVVSYSTCLSILAAPEGFFPGKPSVPFF